MKGLYLRFRRMFTLLFSKEYILIVNKDDNNFQIVHNKHCTSCLIDMVDEAYSVLLEIEEDEQFQDGAIQITKDILNNKN